MVFSLAALFVAAGSAFAAGPTPAPPATPTPRVLVRTPADVPTAARAEAMAAVSNAVRAAGAASVSTADFARVVAVRGDVKVVLNGAREKAKAGVDLDKQQQYVDAVRSLEGAVEDFEFIGADVWLPDEVGKTYITLGFVRWHRDLAQKLKVPSATTTAAWKRGRSLVPDYIPAPPDYAATDVTVMKKVAGGVPAAPAEPGEGLFSLGRLLGLDGVVESKGTKTGALVLRVHKIEATAVPKFVVISKGKLVDAAAQAELRKRFGFPGGPLPALVAVATPAASPSGTPMTVAAASPVPSPTPVAAVSPKPTATSAVASTPTPAATAVAVATKPVPKATPKPTPKATAEPVETPVAIDPSVTPTPAPGDDGMFAGSYAQLLGGADHRAALYTNESAFSSAPSGTSPAGWFHVWYVVKDVWAVSVGGGGMQRVYELGEGGKMKGSTSQEAWLHVLRSDDARGRWWIGAGAAYVNEPSVTGPGGFPEVPQIARITPGAAGVAHFPLGSRFALRGRAIAGIALDSGKSKTLTKDKSGVGYDIRVEGSAAFALSRRVRLAAGASGQRVFTDFGDKTTAVEARRGMWLGVEAGF